MEVSYGIGTTNRYALFYDENEDPMEALKKAQEPPSKDAKEKSKQVEAKPKGKPSAAPVKKDAKEAIVSAKPAEQGRSKEEGQKTLSQRPPQARGDRGGRAPANGNREERNNRRNEDRPRDFSAPMTEGSGVVGGEADYRGRGTGARGGSSRGGRVRGRGRPQDNRGKREYERQSGSDKSGVKPIEKREGAGSHNWGSVKDEIEGQLEVATETWAKEGEPTETTTAEGAENKEATEEGAADAEAAAAAEEEAKVLTLDEWRARRGERKKPEFNIRKPGEGEDGGRWKETFLVEKKKGGETDDDEEEYGEYLQRAGRQKYLDIDIRFADSRRGGTGGVRGGGRGRGTGTRGRGAGRGAPRSTQPRGGSQQHAPKVDDENDFPALG